MQVEDLEQALGAQIRALRVARRLTQRELAEQANVSIGALKHLESASAGATITTLVKVLRALGEERWLSTLGPAPEAFNPLQILAERQRATKTTRRTRVRHRHGASV